MSVHERSVWVRSSSSERPESHPNQCWRRGRRRPHDGCRPRVSPSSLVPDETRETPMRPAVPRSLCVAAILFATVVRADDASLHRALQPLERLAHTGLLYDRVVPLAHLEKLDGSASAPVTDLATWRQAYDELRRASV